MVRRWLGVNYLGKGVISFRNLAGEGPLRSIRS
jgi:hypothetical protein